MMSCIRLEIHMFRAVQLHPYILTMLLGRTLTTTVDDESKLMQNTIFLNNKCVIVGPTRSIMHVRVDGFLESYCRVRPQLEKKLIINML